MDSSLPKLIKILKFQCKCNGSNRVHKVTKMGCKNGGFPKCPRSNNNVCKDGTNVNRKLFIENKGPYLYDVCTEWGRGVLKSRRKEQNQLIYVHDKGEGVQISENFADVT